MNYLRQLIDHANPLTNIKARKALIEILIAASLVFVVAVIVNIISPYKQASDSIFYEPEQKLTHYRATVQSIDIENEKMTVKLHDGLEAGRDIELAHPIYTDPNTNNSIIVSKTPEDNQYTFADYYRLPSVAIMVAAFMAIVILIGRKRGVSSIAGLVISIGIISTMIVPLILAGYDALWVCIIGAFIIAITAVLIAHGFHQRTYISLVCILFLLALVAIASELVVDILQLTGLADEAAASLSIDNNIGIDISALLIGGIIIATLGVLDDIVTTQVATVEELTTANRKLSVRQIFNKAMSVGNEHIASLVNTLALVYAGTALPLILLLTNSTNDLFIFLNSEYLITEVTRTLIASTALVLAVPVSTVAASLWFHKKRAPRNIPQKIA